MRATHPTGVQFEQVPEEALPPLAVSDGYRSARRALTVICALSIAWSAAQFEFKTVALGFTGELDFANASFRLIFFAAMGYAFARCWLEFAMQSVEVRRWQLAQADFMLSANVVRVSVLFLTASGLSRSAEMVGFLAMATVGVLALVALLVPAGMFILIPLLRKHRSSIASVVIEAMGWAQIAVILALLWTLAVLAFAATYHAPLRELIGASQSPMAPGLFALGCALVILSYSSGDWWKAKLFATPPVFVEWLDSQGHRCRTYTDVPRYWHWYIRPPQVKNKAAIRRVLRRK